MIKLYGLWDPPCTGNGIIQQTLSSGDESKSANCPNLKLYIQQIPRRPYMKKREWLIVTNNSQRHLCVQHRLLSPCAMSEGDISSIVPILIRTFSLPNTALPIPPWRTCAWVEGYKRALLSHFVLLPERYFLLTSITPSIWPLTNLSRLQTSPWTLLSIDWTILVIY